MLLFGTVNNTVIRNPVLVLWTVGTKNALISYELTLCSLRGTAKYCNTEITVSDVKT